MAKRLSTLCTSQSRGDADNNHRHPTHLALHVIAVPLFILAALLIIDGLLDPSVPSMAVGVISLIAGLGFQRQCP